MSSNDDGLFLQKASSRSQPDLSTRQMRIAELAANGYSNRDIACELKLTEQIVKNALHSVFDKLGVWNRVELANRFSSGVVKPGEAAAISVPEEAGGPGEPLRGHDLSPQRGRAINPFRINSETGMELRDLLKDPEFPLRKRKRERCRAVDAFQGLARVFADNPRIILQRLVDSATSFCGADSAGISLELNGKEDGERKFRWIAVSGSFAPFLGGTTPRFFSPCGTTLDAGRPQLYRVGTAYYDFLGIKADPITDGILIPWQAGKSRGTIWAVSHRSRQAFDAEDFNLINGLAAFAAIAVKTQAGPQNQEKIAPA